MDPLSYLTGKMSCYPLDTDFDRSIDWLLEMSNSLDFDLPGWRMQVLVCWTCNYRLESWTSPLQGPHPLGGRGWGRGSCMFSVPSWSSPSKASSRAVARPWSPSPPQRLRWRGDEPQALSSRRDNLEVVCLVMWPAGERSSTVRTCQTAGWNHNLEDHPACTTSPTEENHYRWEYLERAVERELWVSCFEWNWSESKSCQWKHAKSSLIWLKAMTQWKSWNIFQFEKVNL